MNGNKPTQVLNAFFSISRLLYISILPFTTLLCHQRTIQTLGGTSSRSEEGVNTVEHVP